MSHHSLAHRGSTDDNLPSDRTWFVSGQPEQLLLGIGAGDVVLARPVGAWHGHDLVLTAVHERGFSCSDLAFDPVAVISAAKEIVAASRRRVRWCRLCRSPFAPWQVGEDGECHGCQHEHRGIVF